MFERIFRPKIAFPEFCLWKEDACIYKGTGSQEHCDLLVSAQLLYAKQALFASSFDDSLRIFVLFTAAACPEVKVPKNQNPLAIG